MGIIDYDRLVELFKICPKAVYMTADFSNEDEVALMRDCLSKNIVCPSNAGLDEPALIFWDGNILISDGEIVKSVTNTRVLLKVFLLKRILADAHYSVIKIPRIKTIDDNINRVLDTEDDGLLYDAALECRDAIRTI
jgi:hypothetical protein